MHWARSKFSSQSAKYACRVTAVLKGNSSVFALSSKVLRVFTAAEEGLPGEVEGSDFTLLITECHVYLGKVPTFK